VRKAATPEKIRLELIVATATARPTGTRAAGDLIVARLNETRRGVGDVGDVDEDERDRRKMEEIHQRLENRKASKGIEMGRPDVKAKSTPVSCAASSLAKKVRTTTDASKLEKKLPGSQKGVKKTAALRTVSSAAGISQRKEAILWAASETASQTSMVWGDG